MRHCCCGQNRFHWCEENRDIDTGRGPFPRGIPALVLFGADQNPAIFVCTAVSSRIVLKGSPARTSTSTETNTESPGVSAVWRSTAPAAAPPSSGLRVVAAHFHSSTTCTEAVPLHNTEDIKGTMESASDIGTGRTQICAIKITHLLLLYCFESMISVNDTYSMVNLNAH